jgi:1A family penicillin-binding protein
MTIDSENNSLIPMSQLKARSSPMVIITRVTVVILFVCSVLVFAGSIVWLDTLGVFDVDETKLQLLAMQKPKDNSLVFDRNGEKIGEYFSSYRVFIPFEKLPQSMINAIIAIEDRNFWDHKGFDPKGILRAGLAFLKTQRKKQGASTLTQQIVRHYYLTREKSIERKVKEIAISIQLERVLTKERILELYANSLFLGNGAYGVGAAAMRYFGKPGAKLATHEAALIAGLFQSPSRYNPSRYPQRARARQRKVLKAMYHAGYLSAEETKAELRKTLDYHVYKSLNAQIAPWFVDYVKDRAEELLGPQSRGINNNGLRIHTTLDSQLQKYAEQAMASVEPLLQETQKDVATLRKGNRREPANLEAAIISLNPQTGEILALMGGRDYAKSQFNRPIQALRSPGSAFKPVVYSLALERGKKWSDVIFVSPVSINNYRPSNMGDKDYLTETTLLRAFYKSMNTPTIELGQEFGLDLVLEQAKKLGVRTPLKREFGTLIGSSDVTMLDMARIFATFANYGRQVDEIAITKIMDRKGKVLYAANSVEDRSRQALSKQVAYLMQQAMRNVLIRGTGHDAQHLSAFAAGKTGTSNRSTDNWFCGFTSNLVTIAWVGTDEHVAIHGNATGGRLALPIWDRLMSDFIKVSQPHGFLRPQGVVSHRVHPRYGHKSKDGIPMYFLRGNEPDSNTSGIDVMKMEQGEIFRDLFTH